MRVLFVTNTFPPDYTGGAEVSLYHSSRGLQRAGIPNSVLSVNNRQHVRIDQRTSVDGISVRRVHFNTRWPWQDILDRRIIGLVQQEIRRQRSDIVHVHNVSGASLAPFVAGAFTRTPVVSTLHDLWLLCPNNMRYRRDGTFCDPASSPTGCRMCSRRYDYWAAIPGRLTLFRVLTANVRRFIAPSQAVIDRHVEAGYDRARFFRLPHGIEEQSLHEGEVPAQVSALIQETTTHPTIVFAGGGVEIKGPDVLLQALPVIFAAIPDLRAIVIGGGDIQRLQAFRRLGPRVHVLGRIPFDQMRGIFAVADLIIFPSVCHEASSMVVYEGLQVGTPAVATDFGGVAELIRDNETGYLFPLGDATALADAVIRHFAQPIFVRRRMRHAALEQARRSLSLDAHIARLREIYATVLGKPESRPAEPESAQPCTY